MIENPTSHREETSEACAAPDIAAHLQLVRQQLLNARGDQKHWTGRLAASSLSTATAISALSVFSRVGDDEHAVSAREAVKKGLVWLDAAQNEDGGFGDTDRSPSNIASSFLAMAAWHLGDDPANRTEAIARLQKYIDGEGGWAGLKRRYGRDKTFVVPILSNCAIAGLVPWSRVPALPFELAAFPQSMYRFVQMPVVSYAIPALVAIGQARYQHAGTWNPITWLARAATRGKTLDVLQKMQPESGGYLEATPLTSFVLMSLSSIGHAQHPVCRDAVKFLLGSQLPDGSWPIDENLATWITSLSLGALGKSQPSELAQFVDDGTLDWLLSCQYHERHPFTGADPGGWGWTDLSGAVPDADDTPAAILALSKIRASVDLEPSRRQQLAEASLAGARWLLGLQNRNGGWPTFCRGWGKLPFDRSGSDLTAHAMRALNAWRTSLETEAEAGVEPTVDAEELQKMKRDIAAAIERGFAYLQKTQRDDGSWLPLWFGNHDLPDDENPYYGTARVLLAYQELGRSETSACRRGWDFLVKAQNPDGGWGGGASVGDWLRRHGLPDRNAETGQLISSSVEETAVVVEALSGSGYPPHRATIIEGVRFLCDAVDAGRCEHPWPIGFYFAKLWYHEQLYPLVFTTAALGQAQHALEPRQA
ncbi:prenyltransferase/squalene oxidase repeat-containing protein [Rosistilla oblonga]|uniref:prenyltransferase/squalene oxidase repeat-containing protein n=1 Tax=Rosistilla oblonga TaxID=2527990 RepID=UPI003A971E01